MFAIISPVVCRTPLGPLRVQLRAFCGSGGRAELEGGAVGLFRRTAQVDGVTIVATPAAAERALAELRRHDDRVHAWDTETAGLVLGTRKRLQSPVTHGYMVCATCFLGEDVDFGTGPRLFIDNTGAADGLIAKYFKEYFEEARYKKVFHNYSFDRHSLRRHGIRLAGFYADTLHLARLWDTSRSSWEGNFQAKLARRRVEDRRQEEEMTLNRSAGMGRAAARGGQEQAKDQGPSQSVIGVRLGGKLLATNLWASSQQHMHTLAFRDVAPEMDLPFNLRSLTCDEEDEEAKAAAARAARGYSLKNLAAHFGITDSHGQAPGTFRESVGEFASVAAQEAHDSPEKFPDFVRYSTLDAELTYNLFQRLKGELEGRPWRTQVFNPPIAAMLRDRFIVKQLLQQSKRDRTPVAVSAKSSSTLWDMLDAYVRDLGECLADMEERGVPADCDRLREIEERASKDVEENRFKAVEGLRIVKGPDGEVLNPQAEHMNMCSHKQLQVLLFGGASNQQETDQVLESTRQMPIPKAVRPKREGASPTSPIELRSLGLSTEDVTKLGWPSLSTKALHSLLGDAATGGDGAILGQMRAKGYAPEDVDRAVAALSCICKMKDRTSSTQEVQENRREAVKHLQTLRGPDGELLNPGAEYINFKSTKQLQVLLFGGAQNRHNAELVLESTRLLEAPAELPETLPTALPTDAPVERTFELNSLGLSPGGKLKNFTNTGWPSTSSDNIRALLGNASKGGDGPIQSQMLSKGFSREDVETTAGALQHMSIMKEIKSRVSGFATPLLEWSSATGRIHPSWMFDTATGRLACRAPNLQNLPSAERDHYKVREAFRPRDGNVFVIADYSQLELCILAHMSGCLTMVEKLTKGGDYHSEVAVDMFPHIKQAVADGEVVVSKDPDRPDIPTIKKKYSDDRSKCKALNFGIVYGKTSRSLAEDLNITVDEAKDLMQAWFDSKPMVQRWLDDMQKQTQQDQCVQSLLGRWRNLPLAKSYELPGVRSKSVRAAQNFGIQGSAADVVMMAMLRLWKDKRLKNLGFALVMQVHDEFVLEGPSHNGEEAMQIVGEVMASPFFDVNPDYKLKLPLRADASVCDSLAGK